MNIQRDLFPNKPIPILTWPRPTYYDNSGTFPNYISTEQIPHPPSKIFSFRESQLPE